MQRRKFLTAAGLGSAALALPSAAQVVAPPSTPAAAGASVGDGRDHPRYPQDAWFDQLPGKHRLFLDATDSDAAGNALEFAWNFLRTSATGYQLKDEDQAVVICLRHYATEFALSNALWAKYEALRTQTYRNPETEKMVKGGNIFRPGSTSPKSNDDAFTWDDLARRGVHFAICGSALRRLAGTIAGATAGREERQRVVDELMAGAPANSHLVASGILAAQRAGEYGYTVVTA